MPRRGARKAPQVASGGRVRARRSGRGGAAAVATAAARSGAAGRLGARGDRYDPSEPKRSEGKGLWRGIFRIPSEVALVEYGRGCRIHRLVIETASESLVDPF